MRDYEAYEVYDAYDNGMTLYCVFRSFIVPHELIQPCQACIAIAQAGPIIGS